MSFVSAVLSVSFVVALQLDYADKCSAEEQLQDRGVPAPAYLANFSRAVIDGWFCDFAADPTLNYSSTKVGLEQSQLVLGFSRGSDQGDAKSVFIEPALAGEAYSALPSEYKPRGFMFWNLQDDSGRAPANGTGKPADLAKGFNAVLHVRR